jgi:hypothetical protein
MAGFGVITEGNLTVFGVEMAPDSNNRLQLARDTHEPHEGYLVDWVKLQEEREQAVKDLLSKRKVVSNETHEIGRVSVDSGQLMLTDPCYIDSRWKRDTGCPEHWGLFSATPNEFSYHGACCQTMSELAGGQMEINGMLGSAVSVRTGWGDGLYPVFATYGEDGRVAEVTVVFIEPYDPEDDEAE